MFGYLEYLPLPSLLFRSQQYWCDVFCIRCVLVLHRNKDSRCCPNSSMELGVSITPLLHNLNSCLTHTQLNSSLGFRAGPYTNTNTHATAQRKIGYAHAHAQATSLLRVRITTKKNQVRDGFRKSNIASRQLSQVTNPGAGAQYLTSHPPKKKSYHHSTTNKTTPKECDRVPNTPGHNPIPLPLVEGVAFACGNGVTRPAQTNRNSFHQCVPYTPGHPKRICC
jgi:hypothetical protein